MNISKLNQHSRATFVKPEVKEISTTTDIINSIFYYYPANCRCISGYLSFSDQFWKVNYHWDLLNYQIGKFLKSYEVKDNLVACAVVIRKVLNSNFPIPSSGYRTDRTVGETRDVSPPERMEERYKIVKQCKLDFVRVLVKANYVTDSMKLNPPEAEKPWWLAVAPVAPPGSSKHGTGYALDISGNNAETTRISTALGASLVFNESSHVHVEWKNGVKIPVQTVPQKIITSRLC
jgi:hypothetical protein